MAVAVFLRAANVGGHAVFKPADVAKKLKALDVVNIGAAGTFVVHGKATASAVKEAFAKALPFETDIVVVPGREILDLVETGPPPIAGDMKAYATVLTAKPKTMPALPLDSPANADWAMRVVEIRGRFALTVRRMDKKEGPDIAGMLARATGVRGTARGWPTMERVAAALRRE